MADRLFSMQTTTPSVVLSRLGVAFCFLGFGIWEILSPSLWTTYLPEMLKDMQPLLLIKMHGIVLTVVGLGVLSGYARSWFTALATLLMLDVCIEIFLQEGFTDVFIRDGALLLFTAALFIDAVQSKRS